MGGGRKRSDKVYYVLNEACKKVYGMIWDTAIGKKGVRDPLKKQAGS